MYNVSNKVKEKFEVESIEVLADKGYYSLDDLEKCEKNNTFCYVPKPGYCNSTNNNIYFSDKFKFNPQDNTYTCPEGQTLKCITKKVDVVEKKYANYDACAKCPHKTECTTAKIGRVITRQDGQEYGDIVDSRAKNKDKYNKRQGITEHVFGTIKRTMNFTHSLLRGFEKVTGEVSFAFFSYNLKRVINILGVEKFLEYSGTPKILKAA